MATRLINCFICSPGELAAFVCPCVGDGGVPAGLAGTVVAAVAPAAGAVVVAGVVAVGCVVFGAIGCDAVVGDAVGCAVVVGAAGATPVVGCIGVVMVLVVPA